MSPTPRTSKTSGGAIVLALCMPLTFACGPDYQPDSPEPTDPVLRDAEADVLANAPAECTLEARPSAVVQLVDERGSVIADPRAAVHYAFGDDTTLRPAQCMGPDCERWVAGYETAGQMRITAEACGGTGVTDIEVTMTPDGCHVETRYPRLTVTGADCELPLTAPPEACDTEARPSVVALTALDAGDVWLPVPANSVTMAHGDRLLEATCLDAGCSQWAAAWETPGVFHVEAQACGQTIAASTAVQMTPDECHVQTQYVPMLFDIDEWCQPLTDERPLDTGGAA